LTAIDFRLGCARTFARRNKSEGCGESGQRRDCAHLRRHARSYVQSGDYREHNRIGRRKTRDSE
jgi:hypothetical protein